MIWCDYSHLSTFTPVAKFSVWINVQIGNTQSSMRSCKTSAPTFLHDMVAWCHSPDAQAAKDEVEIEIKRQGWHLLSKSSPKDDMAIALAQKHKFVLHLVLKYPLAHKEAPSWLHFIQTKTGQLKKWKSVSAACTHAANKTHSATLNDARLERRAVAGLSPETRKKMSAKQFMKKKDLLKEEHCT